MHLFTNLGHGAHWRMVELIRGELGQDMLLALGFQACRRIDGEALF